MKKIIIALMLLTLTSCTTQTKFGRCVGVNGNKDPHLVYEYSFWNIFLGALFAETLIVPIIVVLDALECPVGVK